MQMYLLRTLLFFFKTQRDLKYEAIERVVELIDLDDVPDEYKKNRLFQILHQFGLNEVGYKDGEFDTTEERFTEDPVAGRINWASYPIEILFLGIINGRLELPVSLN